MTGALSSEPLRATVITVSTSRARDGGSDESGEALVALVAEMEGTLAGRELVSDDQAEIERCLRRWTDGGACDLILTTGGTGFAASDVTPEATEAGLGGPAPGVAGAMRAAPAEPTPPPVPSRAAPRLPG